MLTYNVTYLTLSTAGRNMQLNSTRLQWNHHWLTFPAAQQVNDVIFDCMGASYFI